MGENLVDNTAENVENEKEEKEGGRGRTRKRIYDSEKIEDDR